MINKHITVINGRLRRAAIALFLLRSARVVLSIWSAVGISLLAAASAVVSGWRGERALFVLEGLISLGLWAPLLCAIMIAWGLRARSTVATVIEARDAQLNDALLTVISAERDPQIGAPDVIEALRAQVSDHMTKTRVSVWAPWRIARWSALSLALTLCAWSAAWSIQGAELAGVFKTAREAPERITQRLAYTPLIGDLKITIRPPAYTGAPPRFLEGGSGEFEALEGSVVTLEATLSRGATAARIWSVPVSSRASTQDAGAQGDAQDDTDNRAGADSPNRPQARAIPLTLEGRTARGELEVSESLKWSVSLTDLNGVKWREATSRHVAAQADRPPKAQIISPKTGDRVNPERDLEVSLKLKDDYGLSGASVMVAIDSDMSHPEELALSNINGEAWSGKDRLDLRVVEAQGGDRIALWVNVQDNRALDAERGPQTSRSEVVYLEIDSPEWEHRALIDALREHMEAHLTALADRLEVGFVGESEALKPTELLSRWSDARSSSISARDAFEKLLARLAQDEMTVKEVYLAFMGKLTALEGALEDESFAMSATSSLSSLGAQVRSGIEERSAPVERVHEEIIILIEAMVARAALEEMSRLAEELKESRAHIKELMQMYKEQPSDALKSRIRRELHRLKRKMQKMREMMAKLQKQMPKEFLNIDGMKNDKVVDSLQESESQLSSIEDLLEQDKLDEALERLDELANSLDEMAQQLEQDRDELHQETNPELDKALSELMDSTRDLMMSQADLQRDTEAQQAAIDEATAEVIKARQKLLEELKEKVGEVDRIERSLETREMSYLDRIRGDARKAITDLERALDAAMLEEGIDAASPLYFLVLL